MYEEIVAVSKVTVPEDRLREDRDVGSLSESIRLHGLLQPIVLNEDYVLVAGLRRLLAHRQLGRTEIRATIKSFGELSSELADVDRKLHESHHERLVEIDENAERLELSKLERDEQIELKDRLLTALGWRKPAHRPTVIKWDKSYPLTQPPLPVDTTGQESTGDTDQPEQPTQLGNAEIADQYGVSTKTVKRAKSLVRNLAEPEREFIKTSLPDLADNREELKRLGRIKSQRHRGSVLMLLFGDKASSIKEAVRDLKRTADQHKSRRIEALDSAHETYKTIVIDPPWHSSISNDIDPMGKISPSYNGMNLEELKALPIPGLIDEGEGAHVYLWVTNRTVRHGFELLEHWGLRYITMLTWVKHRMGTGHYFRNATEHVLFAVCGSLSLARKDARTHFEGKRTTHSTKPDTFYELVESTSYAPRIDVFAREERPGWSAWGTDAPVISLQEVGDNAR